MPYASTADCHPDRPRKTADGLCDTCYKRRRYQTDPEYREREKERNRQPPRPERHAVCPCGTEFTTTVHNKRYCTHQCNRRHAKQRARKRDSNDRRTTLLARSTRTAHQGPVTVTYLEHGGIWVQCPTCEGLIGIVEDDPTVRRCVGCDITLELLPAPVPQH